MSSRQIVPGDLVLVTGGSGFIGSHIIERLLKRGFRVRVTTRDLKKQDQLAHIKAFPHKEGQLEFIESDLDDYTEATKGVHGVIHTATPYIYHAADPVKEIVEPAVAGVRNALLAAAKSPSVKRVVITSSGGAVFRIPPPYPGYKFTAEDWSVFTPETHAYFCSKRLSEQAGWELWRNELKDKFDFAVVCPSLVFGPVSNNRLNSSQELLYKYFTGQGPLSLPPVVPLTDVRDVAEAHIIAFTHPEAVGKRLIMGTETLHTKNISHILSKHYPGYGVPSTEPVSDPAPFSIDTTPLQQLGLTSFIDVEQMVKDMVESWFKFGLVQKKD